jgi:hypothetical protein
MIQHLQLLQRNFAETSDWSATVERLTQSRLSSFRRFGNSKERGKHRARDSCSYFGRNRHEKRRGSGCFKLAHQLALKIYSTTKSFPRTETFSLVDQMRRAAGVTA